MPFESDIYEILIPLDDGDAPSSFSLIKRYTNSIKLQNVDCEGDTNI